MQRLRSKSTSDTHGGARGGSCSIEDSEDCGSPFLLSPLSHQYCREPRRSEPGIVCSNQDLDLILSNTEAVPAGAAADGGMAARKRSLTMVSEQRH